MKKRLLALLLAGAMSVGLAACGNSGDEGSANTCLLYTSRCV